MKTNSEVLPAEMNGSGKPVGGIEPLNTSYCIINQVITMQINKFYLQ